MKRSRPTASTATSKTAIAFLCASCWLTSSGCRAFTVRLPSSATTHPLSQTRLSLSVEKEQQSEATDRDIVKLLQDLQRQQDEQQRVNGLRHHDDDLQQHYEPPPTMRLDDDDDESETQMTVAPSPQRSDADQSIINARWLLLGAAALYGTNFSLVKLLGQAHLPVGASSTIRFGMAALATFPWLLPSQQEADAGIPQKDQLNAAALGFEVGVYNAIGYVAQAVGLETTAASKSAFLCSLAVVVVPLLDLGFGGKSISKKQMVGTIMAIVGVGILELGDVFSSGSLQLTSGDWASLIQPLCFGLGFWKMERCMHQHPDQPNRSTAAQLMAVFLGSWLYSLAAEPGALSMAHAMEWLSQPQVLFGLFWTGCITTALTVYMETLALKTLSAAETTLIFSTEPIWGTLFAALVMGEQLGIDSAMGAVLILLGCVFSNLGVDGLKKLVPFQNTNAFGTETALSQTTANTDRDTDRASDDANQKKANQLAMLRTGLSAAFGGLSGMISGLWTNVAIGTAVFAMDIEDVVDELLNKLDL